jgi:hypothetical protein
MCVFKDMILISYNRGGSWVVVLWGDLGDISSIVASWVLLKCFETLSVPSSHCLFFSRRNVDGKLAY